MPSTVPIDRAGRIVLPKHVREELAIKPGDAFEIAIHGGSVTLTPRKPAGGFIRKGRALVFSSPGDQTLSAEAVDQILEEGRVGRHQRALPGFSVPNRRA